MPDADLLGRLPKGVGQGASFGARQSRAERIWNTGRYFCIHLFPFGLILLLIVMGWVFEGAAHKVCSATVDQEIETKYDQTREAFFALDKSPQKKQRQPWQSLIEGFKEIYKQHPETPWGEKSMFMVGRVSYALFQWSGMEPDLDLALDHFSRFVNHYPQAHSRTTPFF